MLTRGAIYSTNMAVAHLTSCNFSSLKNYETLSRSLSISKPYFSLLCRITNSTQPLTGVPCFRILEAKGFYIKEQFVST
jgi:hypothetical protein